MISVMSGKARILLSHWQLHAWSDFILSVLMHGTWVMANVSFGAIVSHVTVTSIIAELYKNRNSASTYQLWAMTMKEGPL